MTTAHGAVLRRLLLLVVTGVGVYVVWPSLLQAFSAWPDLATINPWWFLVMLALEAASFGSLWALTRMTLRTDSWFLVATSQLASNAFSRIVPGGAAAGGALLYQMLVQGGLAPSTVATGFTAVTLLTTAVLLALPIISLPAILGGVPVDEGLARAAWLGAGLFVGLFAVGAFLIVTDGPLRMVGRFAQWLSNRRRRPDGARVGLPELLLQERDLVRGMLGSRWWVALLQTAGKVGFDYLALLAALVAVGSDPRASLVILAYVAAMILGMIPITPGGLGFVEAGLTGTLTLAGVPTARAVLAALAYRLVSYWLPLPAGLVAYGLFTRRYRRRTRDRAGESG